MTSLPSLLGAMTVILQTHSLCKRVTNVETKEFSADQFLFKIRSTYPHHHHDEHGKVHPSLLVGDPVSDVQTVLRTISEFISSRPRL